MVTPVKGPADYLALGDWNATCDRCGHKFKASQLRKTWDNLYACTNCWEARQPQDFVRGVADKQSPPWTRPSTDTFAVVCSPNGQSAIPDFGIPGCMIPDYISPFFNPAVDPPDVGLYAEADYFAVNYMGTY